MLIIFITKYNHIRCGCYSVVRYPCIRTSLTYVKCRADSRVVPSQWETSLQCNAVSHWLGATLESVLKWTKTCYVPRLRVSQKQGCAILPVRISELLGNIVNRVSCLHKICFAKNELNSYVTVRRHCNVVLISWSSFFPTIILASVLLFRMQNT